MTKMHENELEINETLVRTLLNNQCPQWSHLSLTPILSSGTDNALFRLGQDYVVRLPRIEWSPGSINKSIEKEYTWLPNIAKHLPVPISEPLFKGHSTQYYPYPWMITKWNEGHNPDFEKENEYELLAKDLAVFLNQLHAIKLNNGPPSRRGVPLKELDEETNQAISELKSEIDIEAMTILWQRFSHISYWDHEPVWVHGDFLPGNIIVKNDRLNAVIDFSDVGIGDPACDLVIAWGLLNFHSRKVFRENLINIDDNTGERGKGWALSIALIMLPYYKYSNPTLAALARRMIIHILSESKRIDGAGMIS